MDPPPEKSHGEKRHLDSTDDRLLKYSKMDPIVHVKERPGMYVGSVLPEKRTAITVIVGDDDSVSFKKEEVVMVPALFKLFDEILTNALDESVRDSTLKNIKVMVGQNFINVRNDGKGIPVGIHPIENVPVPELIFGHLRTGENFGDDRQMIAGQNGLGVKLCNIFSTRFIINVRDAQTGSVYYGEWSQQMSVRAEPKIKIKDAATNGFVDVMFFPINGFLSDGVISADVRNLFARRTLDVALAARDGVSVYFNETKFPKISLKKYIQLYSADQFVGVDEENPHWRVGIANSSEPTVIGLVNGTSAVGNHITYVENRLYAAVIEAVKTKKEFKNVNLTVGSLRARFALFVVAQVNNPVFNSQVKEHLTSYERLSTYTPSEAFVKKIVGSDAMTAIGQIEKVKMDKKAAKATDGKKTANVNVPKLVDAGWAGGAKSKQTTLILTEGDSAASFAIAALEVLGHEKYGVFPLKGKMLNTREATAKQVMENAEIKNLKTILGLRAGETHANGDGLRYGRVICLCDADADGVHIKGLILNFIHHGWAELAKSGFITMVHTPIVRATKGSSVNDFLSLPQVEAFLAGPESKGYTLKYYKGLGSWKSSDAKSLLSKAPVVPFTNDPNADQSMVLAFAKSKADDRKVWITNAIANPQAIDYTAGSITLSEFVNKDLINHAVYNTQRTIPSICDGLKTGQRKILYVVLKKNYKTVKVAQLSGAVSEQVLYLHGEESLNKTIVKMAQDYVGSNNINLLYPDGQFGTRIMNGDDSASARYIFTNATEAAKKIFSSADLPLLTYKTEEGVTVEPEAFWPSLPMILVNGASSIATGFSSDVPMFNPVDIQKALGSFLAGKEMDDLTPWYRGFKGTVEQVGEEQKWVTRGVFTVEGQTIHITELPIGKSFNWYLEFVASEKSPMKLIENKSTDENFSIKASITDPDFLEKNQLKLYEALKLTSTVSFQNVYLFDTNGKIKKYSSPVEILTEWAAWRLDKYVIRRQSLLDNLQSEVSVLESKARFITAVATKQILIGDYDTEKLEAYLSTHTYLKVDNTYNYLLNLPTRSYTMDNVAKINKQVADKKAAHESLSAKNAKQLWGEDLSSIM